MNTQNSDSLAYMNLSSFNTIASPSYGGGYINDPQLVPRGKRVPIIGGCPFHTSTPACRLVFVFFK
jgi:hypothetical protein